MVPSEPNEHNQSIDTPTNGMLIREARDSDVPAITAIFNHAIEHTTASFYKEPRTIDQRSNWLNKRPDRYKVLVAESSEQQVTGWAAMDPWSEKHGYRITTEISYYVAAEFHGKGIGSQLVASLIEVAKENDFRNLLAKICDNNVVSLKVAERFEFECVGTLLQIGEKFDQAYDVHYYQKRL